MVGGPCTELHGCRGQLRDSVSELQRITRWELPVHQCVNRIRGISRGQKTSSTSVPNSPGAPAPPHALTPCAGQANFRPCLHLQGSAHVRMYIEKSSRDRTSWVFVVDACKLTYATCADFGDVCVFESDHWVGEEARWSRQRFGCNSLGGKFYTSILQRRPVNINSNHQLFFTY